MAVQPSGVGPPGSVGQGKGPPRAPKPFVPSTGDFLSTIVEQALVLPVPNQTLTAVVEQALVSVAITPRQLSTIIVQVLVPVQHLTGDAALTTTATLSGQGGVPVDAGTVTLTASSTLTSTGLMYRLAALPPDALLSVSGLTGSYTDIDDSPDSPDANHLTPTGGAIAVRMSFVDTGYTMRTLAGDQLLRVLLRYP